MQAPSGVTNESIGHLTSRCTTTMHAYASESDLREVILCLKVIFLALA
jgi:hypothetical protein